MNIDGSTANVNGDTLPPENTPALYATANDLDFVMTEEEEQAFINETLGIGAPKNEDNSNNTPAAKEEPISAPASDPALKEEAKDQTPPETKPPVEEEKPTTPDVPVTPQTDDLWIEVEKVITDEEGNQKTEKIKLVYDPEDPASFIPDDFTFKSDKQLADILESKQEMANLFKERKSEIETKQAEVETAKTTEEKQAAQIEAWDLEIQDLIDSGVIEAPKAKPEDKNFLEDPSVKEIDAVFKFMKEQNETRLQEGKTQISSFGTAFTMYTNQQSKLQAEAAEKKDQEDAKRKAALIGGASASGSTAQKGYKAGSYSSIYDVPIDLE